MNARHAVEIKDEEIEAYRRDGVVVLRGVIGEHWIELLRGAADRDMAEPGPDAEIFSKPGEPLDFAYYDIWKRIPEFRDYAFNSPVAEIAARLMGASEVNFFSDQLFMKETGARDAAIPWHHDHETWMDGTQYCDTWVPLDPVPHGSGLVFVKRSHRGGGWFDLFDRPPSEKRYRRSDVERAPDIHVHRKEDIVSWDMEPGDCLAFQPLTLHKPKGNQSFKKRRRAVVNRWFGDDATYSVPEPKKHVSYQPSDLRHGEPMQNSSEYPRVWPKDD